MCLKMTWKVSLKTFKDVLESFWPLVAFGDLLGPYGIFQDIFGHFRTFLDIFGTFWVIIGHFGIFLRHFRTFRDVLVQFGTFLVLLKSFVSFISNLVLPLCCFETFRALWDLMEVEHFVFKTLFSNSKLQELKSEDR